jgi:TPR repeat protein
MFNKADMQYAQSIRIKDPQKQQQYALQARGLLHYLVTIPPSMIEKNNRAQAHLLLAKMDADDIGLPFGRDLRSSAQHYLAVLQEGACDDPSLIFEAALGYAELVYRYPTAVPHLPGHLITAYRIMMKSYKNMGADEKEDISNLEAFHNAKLHYALKLFQGAGLPDNKPDYRKARVLLHDIVRSPEYEINPITLNRARALLASMYLRGEGRPDNAPDLSKAALLYEKIMNAPEENVREEDRTEAELALAMINKRQAEEDISQQPSKRQR